MANETNAAETAQETTPKLDTTGLSEALEATRGSIPTAVQAYNGENGRECLNHVLAGPSKAWKAFENGPGKTITTVDMSISAALGQWPAEKGRLLSVRDQAVQTAESELKDGLRAAARNELDIQEGVVEASKEAEDERTPSEQKRDTLLYNLQNITIRETGWLGGKIKRQTMKMVYRVALTFGAVYAVSELVSGLVYFQAAGDQVGAFFTLVLLVLIGTSLADISAVRSRLLLTGMNARSNFRKHFPKGLDSQGNRVYVNPMEWGDVILGIGGTIALLGLTYFILNFRVGSSETDEGLKGKNIQGIIVSLGFVVNWFIVFFLAPHHSEEVQKEYFDAKLASDAQTALVELEQARSAEEAAGKDPVPTDPFELEVYQYRQKVQAAQLPLNEALGSFADNFGYRGELLAEYYAAHRLNAMPACRRQVNAFIEGLINRFKKERKPFSESEFRHQHAEEISSLIDQACPLRLQDELLDRKIDAFDSTFPPAMGVLTSFDELVETIRTEIAKARQEEKSQAAAASLETLDQES